MKVTTIILDWAGTAIDFGSFAPVDAFLSAFKKFGIEPTIEETRAPMGLAKKEHIAAMLAGDRLSALWIEKHGRAHTDVDVQEIYNRFEPALFAVLSKYTEPLSGVVSVVSDLRNAGIKIGSTTGYTRQMMELVVPLAHQNGYAPDCVVCPDDVGDNGRPYPYMLWRNLEKLKTSNIDEVIKIGDTDADMREGKAAGCITVGAIIGSSMLGLSEDELSLLDEESRSHLFSETRKKFFLSGADFVINSISELPALIQMMGGKS